ncbi:putative phage shock protein C, PspC [Bifidobacterium actinocoloniiforme DSM 22766]|uniref:Putative phage shock protein C, PspC n=1 Tax=Bifidobacterium actinocoloniiforme DSM 22766 TaxID=1437605 RepID=A0A086Z1S7_9BIFI|nr:PspC domain-containing protein [Bifidobacterium actinocoloniiforme]AKV55586.1 hypothetical protein AB656_04525 [Bifidobacterium actinocoloniiforme DSM 22766]KFI40477.1 putative phage shock protein C, PspC [Bifidobacterium actinocoloniiforme DSM 22766]
MSDFNQQTGPEAGKGYQGGSGAGGGYGQEPGADSGHGYGQWQAGPGAQGGPGWGQGPAAGSNPNYQQPGPRPGPGPFKPVGAGVTSRFFSWVRGSYLRRSDNRWVGGVCGGLAERLGWSPALVRVIMVVFLLCFGAGAAFYGFAWFILPDKHGVIVAEDLFAGIWHGSMVGIILCWILSIGSHAIIVPALVAVLVLWALLAWSGEQAKRYGWGYGPGWQSGGPVPFDDSGWREPGPAPAGPGPVPGPAPAPRPTPAYGPYGYEQGPSPPGYASSAAPAPGFQGSRVRKARRKPAGPALVLVCLGVVFLSGLVVWGLDCRSGEVASLSTLRLGLIWVGGLSLALGVLLMVLGAMGHRSGGLIPVAVIVLLMAVIVAAGSIGLEVNRNDLRQELAGYETVSLPANEHLKLDSKPEQMRRYERGIFLTGDQASPASVTLDLSDYQANNGKHRVRMNDGSKQDSGCPAGQVRIAASAANLLVKLPRGCSYALVKGRVLNDLPAAGGAPLDLSSWLDHHAQLGLGWDVHAGDGIEESEGHGAVSQPELDVKFVHSSDCELSFRHSGTATLPQDGNDQPFMHDRVHRDQNSEDDEDDE